MHSFLYFVLSALLFQTISVHSCIEHERVALLEFKADLQDQSSRLVSWRGNECCNWAGIRCNNKTGHVTHLNLRNYLVYWDHDIEDIDYSDFDWVDWDFYYQDWKNHSLSGRINPSLFALSELEFLDLSYNNFSENKFPTFVSLFPKLKYLNLSNTNVSGLLPQELGNLSKLQYLDLSNNFYLSSEDIRWLSHLTSLRHLDMSTVNLINSKEWIQPLNKLPSLEVMIFIENWFTKIPESLLFTNFTSLRVLHISGQDFTSTIPNWIFKLHGLTDLILNACGFIGHLPHALGNLTSLNALVLDNNNLQGTIPPLLRLTKLSRLGFADCLVSEDISEVISKLSNHTQSRMEKLILDNMNLTGNISILASKMLSLRYLGLNSNKLSGPIPSNVGNLTKLVALDLSYNSFTGLLTEDHLGGLSKLKALTLEQNPITIGMKSNWLPPFQLETLALDSCEMGPKVSRWIQNQVNITSLSLSNMGIEGTLPNWIWNLKYLADLDLSDNKIEGKLPENLEHMTTLRSLYLDNNKLQGSIPSLPFNLESIGLSSNRFEKLSKIKKAPSLYDVNFSNNSISGGIEPSLCKIPSIAVLDLSSNNLSGEIPNLFANTLTALNLANNKISGTIPSSFKKLNFLDVLQLNNNSLTGQFPSALQYCRGLTMLDLGENKIYGEVPGWVGENLIQLKFLRLRSNLFSGNIPSTLTMLKSLRYLDLANNYFSGSLPENFDNFTSMISSTRSFLVMSYPASLFATVKDVNSEYSSLPLESLTSIDLSNNNLTSQIPKSIVALAGLMNLNLSHNHLIGQIPVEIGNMTSLESLDLCMNNLSGSIPLSISNLYSLEAFNVSYNNLSGSIPTGHQLQTLDNPTIYMGNPFLCGAQLQSCYDNGENNSKRGGADNYASNSKHGGGDRDNWWFYLFTELGFVTGFLVVFFVLMFERKWSCAYFQMVDKVFDMLYVVGKLTYVRFGKECV